MDISTRRLPWLIAMIAASLIYAIDPVSGQGLLRRLEDRVRQRLGEAAALPAPPENRAVLPNAVPPISERPVLGVEVDEVPTSGRASDVVVAVVHPNSAAAAAGLKPGDRITSFGGVPISSVEELTGVMQRSQRGDRLLMIVQRDGQRVDLAVRLQAGGRANAAEDRLPRPSPPPRPPSPPEPSRPSPATGESEMIPPGPIAETGSSEARGRLGLTVEDPQATRGKRLTRGALVVEITPGAAGAEAGLRVGDTIVAFDGTLIPDAESLILQMRRTRPGQRIELQYIRDQKLARAKVTLAGSDDLPAKRSDDPASDEPPSLREATSRNAGDAQMPRTETSESGLGALGSVLGGLFGGGSTAGNGAATGEGNAAETTESPVPESADVLPSPDGNLPPSLETPELENASPSELRETVRRLEATNRRLESRLQQLEERMDAMMQSAVDKE